MDDQTRQRLGQLGLSEQGIQALEQEGVTNTNDMGLLNAAEIRQITECNLITAKKVENEFRATPQPQAVAQPQDLVVKMERPIEHLSFVELLQRVIANQSVLTSELRRAIKRQAHDYAYFVVGLNGIDWEATLALAMDEDLYDVDTYRGMPVLPFEAAEQEGRDAHPVTLEVLPDGHPWMSVSKERRAAFYYHTAYKGEVADEASAITALASENPGPFWSQKIKTYEILRQRNDSQAVEAYNAMTYSSRRRRNQPTRSASASPQGTRIVETEAIAVQATYTKPDRIVELAAEKGGGFSGARDRMYGLMVEVMKSYGYMFGTTVLRNPYNLAAWRKLGTPGIVYVLRTLPPRMRTRENLAVIAQAESSYPLEEFVGVDDATFEQMISMDYRRYGVYDLSIWSEWQPRFNTYRYAWESQIQ